jgi:hypothetical protein
MTTIGLLKSILAAVTGTQTVTQTVGGQPVSPTNRLPVEIDASSVTLTANDGGTPITGASMPAGGVGLTGWLSAVLSKLSSIGGAVSVSNFPSTQPVSGTITANAGTNLNTSALALETGGNLAAIAGRLPGTLGQKTAGNSVSVVLSSDGPFATNFGTTTDTTWDGSSAAGGISLFKYIGSKVEAVRALLAATLQVATPVGAPQTGQKAIAVTGTSVALGSGALQNGVVVKANSANTNVILIGPTGVSRTLDGTGNGYPLAAGEAISVAAANLSQVLLNGAAGDFVSFAGN